MHIRVYEMGSGLLLSETLRERLRSAHGDEGVRKTRGRGDAENNQFPIPSPQSPVPNSQSPVPSPQFPREINHDYY
jgi:hypothetical protein